jgi:hypothetical protein
MPPKTVVLDPLLSSVTPTTPTATTRTMPITQPDPNATPTALVTQPAPSTEARDENDEAPKKKAPKWTTEEDKQLFKPFHRF